VTTFVSVAVLLSLLVPISFYVSIEMVKLIIQVSIMMPPVWQHRCHMRVSRHSSVLISQAWL
jgi:hypothetical protein